MLMNKNNFWKEMFFSPFASGLIDRCVISPKSAFCQKEGKKLWLIIDSTLNNMCSISFLDGHIIL